VSLVYVEAAIGKLRQPAWRDGTAMYYWLIDSSHGLPEYLRTPLLPVVSMSAVSAALTWGTLLLELVLAAALVLPHTLRRYLLPMGIAFHLSIAAGLGLPSFAVVMIAALVLYLSAGGVPENLAGC
jgi:antimicrobial peptide system SdpB family protein